MASIPASFPQFTALPAEIQYLIMACCSSNDLVCLRLTCKSLYTLSPLKLNHCLSNVDRDSLCCKDPDEFDTHVGLPVPSNRWAHRRVCHDLTYAYLKKQAEAGLGKPPRVARCNTPWRSDHCECFTRRSKLHFRLRSWMPTGLRYCGDCDMFTRRKRNHKGRCYHGRPKPRVCEGNLWTHRSRQGAFGRKLWKKWFNNAAMDKFEKRLRDTQAQREENKRYGLRRLEGKEVNTVMSRDSNAIIREYI